MKLQEFKEQLLCNKIKDIEELKQGLLLQTCSNLISGVCGEIDPENQIEDIEEVAKDVGSFDIESFEVHTEAIWNLLGEKGEDGTKKLNRVSQIMEKPIISYALYDEILSIAGFHKACTFIADYLNPKKKVKKEKEEEKEEKDLCYECGEEPCSCEECTNCKLILTECACDCEECNYSRNDCDCEEFCI